MDKWSLGLHQLKFLLLIFYKGLKNVRHNWQEEPMHKRIGKTMSIHMVWKGRAFSSTCSIGKLDFLDPLLTHTYIVLFPILSHYNLDFIDPYFFSKHSWAWILHTSLGWSLIIIRDLQLKCLLIWGEKINYNKTFNACFIICLNLGLLTMSTMIL
jgi:hypothetical protein